MNIIKRTCSYFYRLADLIYWCGYTLVSFSRG